MKKFLLFAAFAVMGLVSVNAQGQFNAGISGGLPVGDFSDLYSFNVTVDASYLWEAGDSFEAGVATGYSHSFGDSQSFGDITIDAEDAQFIPLAGAARFAVSEDFKIGADVGYAIGINEGNDGGFYYAPRVQYGVSESIDIVAAYRGVSIEGGVSFNTLTLGVEFGL